MQPFGFLVIDKPQGMTSHDVVATVRRGIGISRIGHAGTLDPMATGVLVLCIGNATRLSEYVMGSDKVYKATIRLGVETDTYDADGKVVSTTDASHITRADVEFALAFFQGDVQQIPPMYSAIKQEGKKLYELARQDKEVERAPRHVRLHTTLDAMSGPDVSITVTCSPGTYIRSIAHDLGERLGVGGHLIMLRRIQSGSLSTMVPLAAFQQAMADGTWQQYLIDERIALQNMPALYLDEYSARGVMNGRFVPRDAATLGKLCRAYAPDGRLIGILEADADLWKPAKVFHV